MPALADPQHEAFAQARLAGKSQDEAYAAAGYRPHRGNASRLANRPEVVARIAELSEATAAMALSSAVETVEKITGELNEALDMARTQERPDRMVMAAVAKAKLNGLLVDKSESTVTHKHEDRVARRQELLRSRRSKAGDDATAVH